MSAGTLKGLLSGRGTTLPDPFPATGSVVVLVNDIVYVSICQRLSSTSVSVDDNLGNTYTAVSAFTNSGSIFGRAFWARVTNPGTLTTVNVQSSEVNDDNDWIVYAGVYEGPFVASPLDANPSNTTDSGGTTTCPPTGVLAQASELVVSWVSSDGEAGDFPFTANLPMLLVDSELAGNAIRHGQAYKKVSATTSTTPSFSTTDSSSAAVEGTTSFKIDTSSVAISFSGNTTLAILTRAIMMVNARLAGNTTLSIQTRGRLVARAALAGNTTFSARLDIKGKIEITPILAANTALQAMMRQRWASSSNLLANASMIVDATLTLKIGMSAQLGANATLSLNMIFPTTPRLAITLFA